MATNFNDCVKVAWKSGNPLLHQIALLRHRAYNMNNQIITGYSDRH